MKADISIKLKQGVLDPEAKAIQNALKSLGFEGFDYLEMSKKITIHFLSQDAQKVKAQAEKMAKELLANLVIEDFSIEIRE
ncbi:phosphoribosylformylglycinamidine synthase subunit PurS [Helicobacter mustelae]|uniref:Phosphoribosylformylglycinamidine synthase subunit PurS n=1 Tax=Helicobacter mustelae (strain ATCC 43772 / CCUG 25715 / CIP 103759 / LMG 18044 / NCTC 12198 / R85-136P) TaxID=679897 RepID=D3UI73_HELM1|nr:phosphoribosylformylglycinamidine synthase subunit PurS [Helicobacter mustelae]CBG40196.1 Phosphoribosyformylglycinamidine synthase, PurL [Helicobacter mustelae 12198]SQH71698.1 phosphoribosyformylglycinamidine synthase PurL [Helicobacter mustelae]